MKPGKPIHTSSLCLRFYINDGWTKEELDKCCKNGEVEIAHPQDRHPYYTLQIGSHFDVTRLMERVSKVHRQFNDHPTDSDHNFVERMNG